MAINYEIMRPGVRKLSVVKSRYDHLGQKVLVRFDGQHGFAAVAEAATEPKDMAESAVIAYLKQQAGGEGSRRDIVAATGIESHVLDRLVTRLVEKGEIEKASRGRYALVSRGYDPMNAPEPEKRAA